tara:strand:- start:2379 stop:2987 length:609 start_codon:yes stop_codon:yes gene_type:complete
MGFIGVQPATVPLTSSDITDGIISTAKIADDAITVGKLPSGTIIQVKQTTKTDTFSTTSNSAVDVTGLSVSITPTSSSNKILFRYDLSVGGANGADQNHGAILILRDSTILHRGDARGSNRIRATNIINNGNAGQMYGFSASILDSPNTTSAITYKIQVFQTQNSSDSTKTVCINRAGRDADDSAGHDGNCASSITVMEVTA